MSGMGVIWRQLLGIVLGSACVFSANCATAQITPDRTLPNNSNVTINGSTFNITLGTQAGRNLFHSFQQFSVPTNNTAFFNNGLDIQNIISRVTGGSVSNIDGLIKASGTANLFFLNPNGIVFGKNARLNIGGSFVATTANAIQFGNLGTFSADVPNNPALLTINPSALLFNQIAAGASIQNSSIASNNGNVTGLQVPDSKSLLLVGGNINLDGGVLTASSGRVELAGLAAPGTIGLNVAGDTLSLSVPSNVQQGNVSLTNQAKVDVSGAGRGDIAVNAGNLDMSNSSDLLAGVGTGLGDGSTKAGDININADSISISDAYIANFTNGKGDTGNIFITARDMISTTHTNSTTNIPPIVTIVLPDGVGNGGNIDITTGSLSVTNTFLLGSLTDGKGNAGNITIQGRDAVTVNGGVLVSDVEAGAVGNGGKIDITAGSLSLTNGGRLGTRVREASNSLAGGQGKGGTVNLNVRDALTISGTNSGIFSDLGTGAVGRAGDIKVQAGNVFVKDGGQIRSSTFGKGDAGNVTITARDAVTFDGVDSNGFSSGSSSEVEAGAVGNGGNINITAGSLSLTNGSGLSASIREASNSLAGGQGKGGSINLNVRDALTISGANSGIFANLNTGAVGRGGDIKVQSENIFVTDGGQINSFTRGTGNAGNVTIIARDAVTFDGVGSNGNYSGLFSDVQGGAVGNGGSINITANSLSLTNGATLGTGVVGTSDTLPSGQGDGGFIDINLRDTLTVSGGGSKIAVGLANGTLGRSGNIKIESGKVQVLNGGIITSRSQGRGAAGDIDIKAKSVQLNNGQITAQTTSSDGGNIIFHLSQYLLLRNGSLISANAGTAQKGGNGGNITINTPFLVAVPNENSDIIANAFSGSGGKIQINATGVFGLKVLSREDLVRLLGTNDLAQLDLQRLPTSAITAVSQTNPTLSGTVVINTANINPSQELVPLSTNLINPNTLIANSCIARTKKQQGTFNITGTGGLPNRPGDVFISSYPTGTVRNVQGNSTSSSWHKGDPIVEPQGVYQLPNGHLVLSRECS